MGGDNERTSVRGPGPLAGLRVVEFPAIGPAPFGVMLLADLGAEILRIQRSDSEWPDVPIVSRGRANLTLDLKNSRHRESALRIAGAADVVVEGFRPGVMERLGLGPDIMLGDNPRLVYGRMTGWGQDGPLAETAGHDLNYIGLTGMLDMLAAGGDAPRAPHNLLGDYACGGLYLALGILAAVFEREKSGLGQIIDAAIIDGSASLLAPLLGMIAAGLLPADPRCGMLSGSAPYYRTYRCKDGRFLAVAPLEKRFRASLSERLGLSTAALDLGDSSGELEALFTTRTRDEWISILTECDCCVTPVLNLEEAQKHPQIVARSIFNRLGEELQPAPAPRFSRTPARIPDSVEAKTRLREWQVSLAGIGS